MRHLLEKNLIYEEPIYSTDLTDMTFIVWNMSVRFS